MITKVRLRNWKSHLDSEFSFSKGVNALVGIMGSGKSSVTDAISFGLFGSFPTLQTRKVMLDGLLMERPQKKDLASVEIEFLANGKTYQVKREIKRGKVSSAEIRENGVLKEVSAQGVTREVERILGMDYEVFSKAVYSEQNGIDYFLRIPSGKRRDHIDRMLRLDRFELVRGETKSLQNKLKATLEEKLRVTADMEREGMDKKILVLTKEIDTLRKRGERLEKKKGETGKEREGLEGKVASWEDRESSLQETTRLFEGLKGGLEEIRNREGKSRKIVRGKDLGRIDIEIKKLEQGIEAKKQELDSLKEGLHSSETRKKLTSENLENIGQLQDQCPLCESDISPEKKEKLMKDREKELEGLEGEIAKKHLIVFEKGKELGFIEQALADKRIERERASHAFREIKELEEKLKEILSAKNRYEERISSLHEGMLGIDVKTLRKKLQESVSREREIITEIRELQERIGDKEEVREGLDERFSLLKTYKKEVEEGGRIVSQLGDFEQALKLTQEELRKEFLKNVNLILDRVWGELYPYGDFQSVRLGVEEGDYVLQLKGVEWKDADAVSGGERSLACLALRIAFSLSFLPNLKWLILDEPTHNLDRNAIASFAEALREKLPRFAEQVFIITHDPTLSEGLEQVYQLERNKDAGEATIVKRV